MARRPDEDPRVTDLRRYRKERERQRRRQPQNQQGPSQPFLGSNPRAGLVLALIVAALLIFWVLPRLLRIF